MNTLRRCEKVVEDAVGDAMALDRVAGASLGVDDAISPAQPTTAEGFASVLGRDGLVGFARRAIEVEDELVRRCQAALPVARQARALIPDIPAKAPPARGAHPFHPSFPIGLPLAVAVDEADVDQQLTSGLCSSMVMV